MMTECDLANWEGDGGPEYLPRIRMTLQSKKPGIKPAEDDEAPELDDEIDWYDCD